MTKTQNHKAAPKAQEPAAPTPAEAPPATWENATFAVTVETTHEVEQQALADSIASAVAGCHVTLHPSNPLTSIVEVQVTAPDDVKGEAKSDPRRYDPHVTW